MHILGLNLCNAGTFKAPIQSFLNVTLCLINHCVIIYFPQPPWATEMLTLNVWALGNKMLYEIRYSYTQPDWLIESSRDHPLTPSKNNNGIQPVSWTLKETNFHRRLGYLVFSSTRLICYIVVELLSIGHQKMQDWNSLFVMLDHLGLYPVCLLIIAEYHDYLQGRLKTSVSEAKHSKDNLQYHHKVFFII